jgi:hypothetical protein
MMSRYRGVRLTHPLLSHRRQNPSVKRVRASRISSHGTTCKFQDAFRADDEVEFCARSFWHRRPSGDTIVFQGLNCRAYNPTLPRRPSPSTVKAMHVVHLGKAFERRVGRQDDVRQDWARSSRLSRTL